MKNPFSFGRRLYETPFRLPRLRPYVPKADDPAIYWFNGERDSIVGDVISRVTANAARNESALELALNDAAFNEIRRLSSQRDTEAETQLPIFKSLAKRLSKMSDTEKQTAARKVVSKYARDIAGNFDPRVYQISEHAVPRMLTGLLRPSALPVALSPGADQSALSDLLQVDGNIEHLRKLEKTGTLVFVPTHSSNLDSIVLGRALQLSGLSPVVYGAGKNLFTNPIISFFMHNLGAYRVDRRIRARLYKDTLKMYSQVMIERGYHSLFFPGGTRSRSNLTETRLKLGLAGSAVNAFSRNRVRGVDRNVYFVPTTINYEIVLEGETLVEDWLKSEGKARYIITDDEFSRFDRWIAFFRKIVELRSACVIRFGTPLDPFGNPVSEDGLSITPSGGTIDPGTYVWRRGEAVEDRKRDAAFTSDLGDALVNAYRNETVLMPTSLVCHVLFRKLVQESPGLDLFARLRVRGETEFDRSELVRQVGQARDRLLELETSGGVKLSDPLRDSPDAIVDRALKILAGYHDRTAATQRAGKVIAEDPTLLLYYQNRMVPYALDVAEPGGEAAAQEIEAIGRAT